MPIALFSPPVFYASVFQEATRMLVVGHNTPSHVIGLGGVAGVGLFLARVAAMALWRSAGWGRAPPDPIRVKHKWSSNLGFWGMLLSPPRLDGAATSQPPADNDGDADNLWKFT
ncbi:hypothetical protein F3Y22_tig00110303pilonHSYRG00244 [Hibiscus syriacus]|uniref:Uncharacterized protein n=1 Tax=Hibiscus syriacus TaxID=106335 RepID=A0A6A3B4D2_HIBSY|nr:hypothetical protein F3Y22_tig00110303pilonHSYRG00244 [Hibiscus syriacus]